MGWGSALLAEWRMWLTAWRNLAQNPVAHYFRLARQRRIAKMPGWRRRMPYLIIITVAAAGVLVPTVVALITTLIESGTTTSARDLAVQSSVILLSLLSALYCIFMLTGIFETALAVMGLLGKPGIRIRGHALDDMIAITLVSDYEITVAAIRIYWPRLLLISLFGAGILWLWMLFLTLLEGLAATGIQPMLTVLAFGPLTIGAVTLSGALAGLIYILWLICAGRGLRSAYFASGTGAIVALAHLATAPLATGVYLWIAEELTQFGTIQGPDLTSAFNAPLMSLGLIAGFILMLIVSEYWGGVRPFILMGAPFLIPGGAVLIALLGLLFPITIYTDQVAFEYVASWRAFSLVNSAISLPPPCFGSWNMNAMAEIPLEWFRYPLLIASQLILAVTALHFTRRAVQLRRRNFE
jgi:hypothetical protein